MDVDAAKCGHIQHLLGQDSPIGHHGADIGLQIPQLLHRLLLPEVFRLEHGDFRIQRHLLHRGGHQLHAPALGPVRLGIDPHHIEAIRQNPLQAGGRNVRGAHENNSQASSSVAAFNSSSVRKRSMTSV